MAVTRKCREIYAGRSINTMADLQGELNKVLGPHERIVHMGQKEPRSSTWYVVTEELIMGPP